MNGSHTSYHLTSALPFQVLACSASNNHLSHLAARLGILPDPSQVNHSYSQHLRIPALPLHGPHDIRSSASDRQFKFATPAAEQQALPAPLRPGSSSQSQARRVRRHNTSQEHSDIQHALVTTLASSQSSSTADHVQIRKLTSRLGAAQRRISQLEVDKTYLKHDMRQLQVTNAELAAQIRRQPPSPSPPRPPLDRVSQEWVNRSSPSPVPSPARSSDRRRRSSSSPLLVENAALAPKRLRLSFPASAAQRVPLSPPGPPRCAPAGSTADCGRLVAGGRSSSSDSELSSSKSIVNWVSD
jgi:hypothetical protein